MLSPQEKSRIDHFNQLVLGQPSITTPTCDSYTRFEEILLSLDICGNYHIPYTNCTPPLTMMGGSLLTNSTNWIFANWFLFDIPVPYTKLCLRLSQNIHYMNSLDIVDYH